MVNDIIVQLNNIDITNLSHQMINEVITGFTDSFVISVDREVEYCEKRLNTNGRNEVKSMKSEPLGGNSEEYIAEVISGEAEILKDHNILG